MNGEAIFNLIRKLMRDYERTRGRVAESIYVYSLWMPTLKRHVAGLVEADAKKIGHGMLRIDGVHVWATAREGVHVH